jgi:hypothetical protein
MWINLHVKHNETYSFLIYTAKILKYKVTWISVLWILKGPCGNTDGRTDVHSWRKLRVAFCNCAKASKHYAFNAVYWNCLLVLSLSWKLYIFRGQRISVSHTCWYKLTGFKSLISNFRRVLYVVCVLLGNSPASEFYMPTFRNTLSVPSL